MSNIHEFRSDLERKLAEEQKRYDDAVNEKIIYGELREEAAKKEKAAKAAIKDLEAAKMHADKLAESYEAEPEVVIIKETPAEDTTYTEEPVVTTREVKEDDDVVVIKEKTTKKNSGRGIKGFVLGAAAVCLLIGGWKLCKEAKAGNVKLTGKALIGTEDETKTNSETNLTDNGDINYNQ